MIAQSKIADHVHAAVDRALGFVTALGEVHLQRHGMIVGSNSHARPSSTIDRQETKE